MDSLDVRGSLVNAQVWWGYNNKRGEPTASADGRWPGWVWDNQLRLKTSGK